MGSVERVRALTAEGYTARQIAEAIGITKTRVYQIAKSYGIGIVTPLRPEKAPKEFVPKVPKPAVARVITGGVSSPLNTTIVGTISEVLAAADLMSRGWGVYMPLVRHRGFDLLCEKEGKIIKVEVRSAHRTLEGKVTFGKSLYDRADVYALVTTGDPVSYSPDDVA